MREWMQRVREHGLAYRSCVGVDARPGQQPAAVVAYQMHSLLSFLGSRKAAELALVILCLCFVFLFGLRIMKSEPLRPADYNSIKPIYVSRSHPNESINSVVRFVAIQDPSHMPLYHVALSLWVRYTGRDLFTIRLLSLLTGLLAIAVTHRLVRSTGGREAALDAVILTSFLAFFLFYTHQARMYALLALVSPWVLWSYWRLLQSANKPAGGLWLSLLVSSVAIIYTHYFGLFLLAAIGSYHLLFAAKNRRWWQISLALACAVLLFLPWTPYTLAILESRQVSASDALSFGDALSALISIYANGQPTILVAAGVLLLLRIKRLKRSQAYLVFLALAVFALLLVANEITALIIAHRIRYTIAAGLLLTNVLAIALNMIPRWPRWRPMFMALWIVLFVIYWRSDDLYLYTNQLHQRQYAVPHYQNLLYEPSIKPRSSDFVVSFHPDTPINDKKLLDYYGRRTGNWRGLIHIWNDESGNPAVLSTDTRYDSVPSMARWNFPQWLIYNPQEADLQAMGVYTDDYLTNFHACGRYLDTKNTVIELYIKLSIPCQLLTAINLQAIRYDNGTELANVLVQHEAGELGVSLWWTNTIANKYAVSIQVFDAQNEKAAQLDDVIGGDPVHRYALDLSELAPGDYTVSLIVYDFESGASQSGTIVADDQTFDRSVAVWQFSIDN